MKIVLKNEMDICYADNHYNKFLIIAIDLKIPVFIHHL